LIRHVSDLDVLLQKPILGNPQREGETRRMRSQDAKPCLLAVELKLHFVNDTSLSVFLAIFRVSAISTCSFIVYSPPFCPCISLLMLRSLCMDLDPPPFISLYLITIVCRLSRVVCWYNAVAIIAVVVQYVVLSDILLRRLASTIAVCTDRCRTDE
jgi:hypothetical protein